MEKVHFLRSRRGITVAKVLGLGTRKSDEEWSEGVSILISYGNDVQF